MAFLSSALAFIKLGRPHFLVGGFLLHGLGVTIALYSGAALNISALFWGQLAITATQLMTHYANDYFDLEADRANLTPTMWSGGSRVLVRSAVPQRLALFTALLLAVIAAAATLVLSLVVRPGWSTFLLLAVAQLAAWSYSAPPLRLHSRGLGELTTAFVVTLLTPLTGYVLQTGQFGLLPLLAVIPLCGFQFAMLLSIEFPDAEGDRAVNKNTLVIQLGMHGAARLYVVVICASFAILPLVILLGLPLEAGLSLLLFTPLVLLLLWQVRRGHWRNPRYWNRFGFHTILLLMGGITTELGAFILLIGIR